METGISIPTVDSGEEKPFGPDNATPAVRPPASTTGGDAAAADFQGSSATAVPEAATGARCKVCQKDGAMLTCSQCKTTVHRDCHLPAVTETIR